jgi:hypothetical protein
MVHPSTFSSNQLSNIIKYLFHSSKKAINKKKRRRKKKKQAELFTSDEITDVVDCLFS